MSEPVVRTWAFQDETRRFVERGLWQGKAELPENSWALAFANKHEGIVGGVVYHNWNPLAGVIELTAYSARPIAMTRGHVEAIFAYPFHEAGVRLVLTRYSAENHRLRSILRRLGVQEHVIPELRGPGEAEVIGLVSKAAWREFLERGYDHVGTQSTEAA